MNSPRRRRFELAADIFAACTVFAILTVCTIAVVPAIMPFLGDAFRLLLAPSKHGFPQPLAAAALAALLAVVALVVAALIDHLAFRRGRSGPS